MKPVLFLDFDRTLFDTDKLYEWIGENRVEKFIKITSGEMTPPDYSTFLYADTRKFLELVKLSHHIVLMTFTINITLQGKKIHGSGIMNMIDDVIMVSGGANGSTGKGVAVKSYLSKYTHTGLEHIFIDDSPQNIDEVKRENPEVRCVRIDRIPHAQGMMHGALLAPDYVISMFDDLQLINL